MGAWRQIDEVWAEEGVTHSTAPLSEREAILERSELPPRNWSTRGPWSMTPGAIAKRAERARRRQQQAPGEGS